MRSKTPPTALDRREAAAIGGGAVVGSALFAGPASAQSTGGEGRRPSNQRFLSLARRKASGAGSAWAEAGKMMASPSSQGTAPRSEGRWRTFKLLQVRRVALPPHIEWVLCTTIEFTNFRMATSHAARASGQKTMQPLSARRGSASKVRRESFGVWRGSSCALSLPRPFPLQLISTTKPITSCHRCKSGMLGEQQPGSSAHYQALWARCGMAEDELPASVPSSPSVGEEGVASPASFERSHGCVAYNDYIQNFGLVR